MSDKKLSYNQHPLRHQVQDPEIAFIIGCGRTGTHMIGHYLNGPEARVCFENRPLEKGNPQTAQPHWLQIHAISRNPRVKDRFWTEIIANLTKLRDDFKGQLFIDKSNQNMNWVEELIEIFPRAKFIGCTRDVIPVVRSMAQHNWMQTDALYADSCETPNLFYGAMSEEFFSQGILGRFVWRWAMAQSRLKYLERTLHPSQFTLMTYEDFVSKPLARSHIAEFLGVNGNDSMGITNRNEANQGFFTEDHLGEINEAVRRYEELHGAISLGRGPEWNPQVKSLTRDLKDLGSY